MTKLDRAIEALAALPQARSDEVADMVLELARCCASQRRSIGPEHYATQNWHTISAR